eukprot:11386062-Ditylum_brightwellii.AAC.1
MFLITSRTNAILVTCLLHCNNRKTRNMSKSDFPSKTVPAAKARSIGKVCAIVFGLLAVSIGIIAKVRPHPFMALPFPLSVILWTAAAG